MIAQYGLLPTYVKTTSIDYDTPFTDGQVTQHFSLSTTQNPDMIYSLYNGVYDQFKVVLECSNNDVAAWVASGTNLASSQVDSFGCGQFFTVKSANT